MSKTNDLDLLDYYTRELDFLRKDGKNFAQRFPKVASRLDLRDSESLDPHTERLIESVAFLSARVRRDIDREYSEIASGLLGNLCPSLVQPIPSTTVVQISSKDLQGKVTTGIKIPRHTLLSTKTTAGDDCKFRTVWDSKIMGIDVVEGKINDEENLFLKIRTQQKTDLSELTLNSFSFHIAGEWSVCSALYEALSTRVKFLSIKDNHNNKINLNSSAIRFQGFQEDEIALPQAPGSHPAYSLLQEYFSFPQKFFFFELNGLPNNFFTGSELNITIDMGGLPSKLRLVDSQNFKLNCIPVINIFSKISEPITINHKNYEYLLVADRTQELSTEVHSVVNITASEAGAKIPKIIPQFSELESDKNFDTDSNLVFWSFTRRKSLRKDFSGTDIFLNFVDKKNFLNDPTYPILYANLLCTNRRLAEQLPVKASLTGEGVSAGLSINCLYEPSRQRDPPLGSETIWKLTSLLSLNHHSLIDGETSKTILREILALFASDNNSDLDQIRGVLGLKAKGVTRKLSSDAWRGFCRGIEIEIELDPESFVGSSMILFSLVLSRFFSLYTTINSFISVSVVRGNQKIVEWPPIIGRQEFI